MAKEIIDLIEEILDNDLDFSEPWHVGIFNLPEKMDMLIDLFETIHADYNKTFFYREFHFKLFLFKQHALDRINGKAKDYEFGYSWQELFNLRLHINYKAFQLYVTDYIKGNGIIHVSSEDFEEYELN